MCCVLIAAACAGRGSEDAVTDPIAAIPRDHQRTISRDDFRRVWPFSVGAGTLGCSAGAVVFRSAGASYALNGAARERGFAAPDPIRLTRQVAPSNPLGRLKQNRRVEIFAALAACGSDGCKQQLRQTQGLSDAELKQIEAEGAERRWPPLAPERISLAPVLDAGLKLCEGRTPSQAR
jgi:hypothetical protein